MGQRRTTWLTVSVGLFAFSAPPAAADAAQKARYMAACLSLQKKQHICNCFYQTAIVDLSDREIELQIAYFEKDNPKQAAIRSEPGFDYDAYNAKAEASLLKTLACVKDAKK